MDIHNLTKRPLAIKLPEGKVLRLGPGNTGQITAKAAEHPPVKQLIADGVIEIVGDGGTHGKSGPGGFDTGSGQGSMPTRSSGGAVHKSGDR